MNWFKRHLNWTILIAVLVGPILVFPAVFVETAFAPLIMFIIHLMILVIVCGWVLEQKGRSSWNLLWLLSGVGIIIFWTMDNLKGAELETSRETVDYTPGKCPYCGASNPDEKIKRGPYYGDERAAQGYTYMWDCHCHGCHAKWYALER